VRVGMKKTVVRKMAIGKGRKEKTIAKKMGKSRAQQNASPAGTQSGGNAFRTPHKGGTREILA